MQLEVSFRNINPREEVKKRAQTLYGKLDRFLDPASEGHMIVSVEHNKAIVEIVVTSRGTTYKALEEDAELKASIDKAFHRLEDQLRRSKEKRTNRKGRGDDEADGFGEAEAE